MLTAKYYPDIFYNTSSLLMGEKRIILHEAKEKCFNWRVDDQPSWTRREIKMPFANILKKLKKSCHFVIIHRRGYDNWKKDHYSHHWCLEIGFSETRGTNHHFLWILCEEEHLSHFIKKYNLKIL